MRVTCLPPHHNQRSLVCVPNTPIRPYSNVCRLACKAGIPSHSGGHPPRAGAAEPMAVLSAMRQPPSPVHLSMQRSHAPPTAMVAQQAALHALCKLLQLWMLVSG